MLRTALDLSGRVAVVTGAASGIGRSSAEVLADLGATVVCADINEAGAEATAKAIADAGGVATATAVDTSSAAAVDALVAGAVADHGRLDVMANIAGIMHSSSVIETRDEDLDRVLSINFKGVFYGCRAAARVMVEQGSGSIINMASGAIDAGNPNLLCYSAAKVAVVQLTKTLATEVGPSGVRVNAVAPGWIVTGMTGRHWTAEDGTEDEDRKAAVAAPMKRLSPLRTVGEPTDISYAVAYLASDAAKFMTGQILRPNGGVNMPW
ncbi:SDR family NAD(P)-dependent oxidoreductase [Yinghuangia seranimata]|uniref:SDR family NAD(P)-dependent oxidoreductase n=1 Tax=Yinghuangia seranimata TaxID=408067 RepID=UPI00248C654E|nr:SDR family NAD(P)-dependent oxidoreductase [Yinghuangia seranimata]MDI2132390.1 SDR family NAD(P)-dependent oxidoreductase [Yinghuangia seranimata]